MPKLGRDTVQKWIESDGFEAYICPDCDGIHFPLWEEKEGVLESRCFVESSQCSMLVEFSIRASAVLPLQGAIHFMNYDFTFIKVMLSLSDHDIPRLLVTYALPTEYLEQPMFSNWLSQYLQELEAIHKQLVDMEVLMLDNMEGLTDFDDLLH